MKNPEEIARRQMMNKILQLFFVFFKIGLVSFGGGYVILPMIEKEVIIAHQWLDKATFVDIIGIAAITPGPISLNTATFVGYKISGPFGGLIATTGVVLPSFIITLFISKYYFKNKDQLLQKTIFYILKPLIVCLIFLAALSLSTPAFLYDKKIDYISVVLFLFSFLLLMKTKINPIFIIIISGVLSLAINALIY